MKIETNLRLGLGQNDRKHWRATHRQRKGEHEAIGWLLRDGQAKPATPCVFVLTRIAPSNGLDDDNLAGAWKAGRDAIAAWMGVDDRKRDVVAYEYRNERGPWGIRIESFTNPIADGAAPVSREKSSRNKAPGIRGDMTRPASGPSTNRLNRKTT